MPPTLDLNLRCEACNERFQVTRCDECGRALCLLCARAVNETKTVCRYGCLEPGALAIELLKQFRDRINMDVFAFMVPCEECKTRGIPGTRKFNWPLCGVCIKASVRLNFFRAQMKIVTDLVVAIRREQAVAAFRKMERSGGSPYVHFTPREK